MAEIRGIDTLYTEAGEKVKFKKIGGGVVTEIDGESIGFLRTTNIIYSDNSKDEAMEKFNNPDLIFGKDNMPYLLMIYDWVGAGSPFGGGCTMVLGYQYNNALHGVQVKIKYNDGIRIRYMNEGNWTNWKVISIA